MKKIVIIGGGFAGSYCAKNLEKDFEVTLIDAKDYFEFTPSVLRTLVDSPHIRKIQILHSHYLHKSLIVKGEVTAVEEKEVVVDGKKFEYDYLIISSGSRYSIPIKEKDVIRVSRAHELRNYAAKLKKSSSALIIGGGLVGVELAAEIIEAYPQKKVTILEAGPELLRRNPEKVREYALNFLKKRQVEIIFNEKMEKKKGNACFTNAGKKIEADIVFLCTGIMPNYEFLKQSCSLNLTEANFICVNKYLQIENHKNIFAAGDITAIKEEKTAQNAEKQAEVVVKNIYRKEKGKELCEYESKPRPMVISLGKHDGTFVYKDFILTGIIPGLLKGFIEWKTMRKYR